MTISIHWSHTARAVPITLCDNSGRIYGLPGSTYVAAEATECGTSVTFQLCMISLHNAILPRIFSIRSLWSISALQLTTAQPDRPKRPISPCNLMRCVFLIDCFLLPNRGEISKSTNTALYRNLSPYSTAWFRALLFRVLRLLLSTSASVQMQRTNQVLVSI